MLLELLSDFQISIPELGRIEARTQPRRAADLQQLARADRGAQAPLPVPVARLPRRSSTSWRSCACTRPSWARRSRASSSRSIAMVRELDLKKPPSIAESIDWARALLLLGAEDIDARRLPRDDVDHRQAPHRPRRRRRARRRQAGRAGCVRPRRSGSASRCTATTPAEPAPEGLGARCSSSARSCAARAWRSAPRELLDAFAALGEVPWTERAGLPRGARRHAGQVPGGPPRLRARLRALLLPGRRDGGACARASREGGRASTRRAPSSTSTTLRQQIAAGAARGRRGPHARPRPAGDRRVRPPGRGLRGDRRRRAAHPPRARPARRAPARPARRRPAPRGAAARRDPRASRRSCAASSSARQIERTRALPPARPLNELDRALPSRPAAGPRRGAPRRRPAQAPPGDPGPARRAATAATRTSTCAARCAPRCRPAACRWSSSTARARPRRPEIYVLCDVSTSSPARRVFFLRCCTRCTTRSARCARSCSSSASPR